MSIASGAVILAGQLALESLRAYAAAKADAAAAQAAMNEADKAVLAEIDAQLADEAKGSDAADKRLNDDIAKAEGKAQ